MNNVIEDFAKEVKLPCAIDENGKTVSVFEVNEKG